MNKLDSVKPIGMPQGTSNLIKPVKVSSVDFEAIPYVAEKVKNVSKFSTLDNKKEKHLETRTWCIRTPVSAQNHLDFCQGSKYLDDRFHEVSNHTHVNTGRSKIAEKESKEQPNLDSRLYHHCLSTTTHELDSKNNF